MCQINHTLCVVLRVQNPFSYPAPAPPPAVEINFLKLQLNERQSLWDREWYKEVYKECDIKSCVKKFETNDFADCRIADGDHKKFKQNSNVVEQPTWLNSCHTYWQLESRRELFNSHPEWKTDNDFVGRGIIAGEAKFKQSSNVEQAFKLNIIWFHSSTLQVNVSKCHGYHKYRPAFQFLLCVKDLTYQLYRDCRPGFLCINLGENQEVHKEEKMNEVEDKMAEFFKPAASILPQRANEFFQPAASILPQRAGRDSGGFVSSENSGGFVCETHTVLLRGRCWVLCDSIKLWPCDQPLLKMRAPESVRNTWRHAGWTAVSLLK